jgi:ATP-dependent 26S proteasome regulatory subunit
MQELDRFNSVVIVTTNLFKNYDPALLRRIQRHVEFKLPTRSMRQRLFQIHLPKRQHVSADLAEIAREAKGLSGGDILNVCVNSMHAASLGDDPTLWRITDAILSAEIAKVRQAKRAHGGARGERPAIGFNVNGEASR